MPLVHSKSSGAFKKNVSTLLKDVGKSPHVQSREQALAIAYSTQRRAKKADGGATDNPYHVPGFAGGGSPFGERMAARQLTHEGFLHSTVPGRTDKLPIAVKGGAYVLPADHVAALGQGNSLAGAATVNKMFKMGPYGTSPTPLRALRGAKRADGGASPTDIIAAGGEIVIPPEAIIDKYGDLDKGHKALDAWVVNTRKKHIKTLRNLKPPKKN